MSLVSKTYCVNLGFGHWRHQDFVRGGAEKSIEGWVTGSGYPFSTHLGGLGLRQSPEQNYFSAFTCTS